MRTKDLHKAFENLPVVKPAPVLFLGHGNPMNAIEENSFVNGFRAIGNELEKPNAILCISAHWETKGTRITAMQHPRTIHDFGGFPPQLYEVEYPAPGHPRLANEICERIHSTAVEPDTSWGLDHGTWSVIKHIYPQADVPVIQLSLDYTQAAQHHYQLAKELQALRHKNVLIIGSGNLIHNLRLVDWNRLSDEPYAYNWAIEANEKMKQLIMDDNHQDLINYHLQGQEFKLAIPTPEHFLPLLYILALKNAQENVRFFNDQTVGGSLSMTSVLIQ